MASGVNIENFDTFPKMRIVPSNELPKFIKASNERYLKIKNGYHLKKIAKLQQAEIVKPEEKENEISPRRAFRFIQTPKAPNLKKPLYLNIPSVSHTEAKQSSNLAKEIEAMIWEGDSSKNKKKRANSGTNAFKQMTLQAKNIQSAQNPINTLSRPQSETNQSSPNQASSPSPTLQQDKTSTMIGLPPFTGKQEDQQQKTPQSIYRGQSSEPQNTPQITILPSNSNQQQQNNQEQQSSPTKISAMNYKPRVPPKKGEGQLSLGIERIYQRLYGHAPTIEELSGDHLWLMRKVSDTLKTSFPTLGEHFREGMRVISLMQYASEKSDEKYSAIEKQKAAHLIDQLVEMYDLYQLDKIKFLTPQQKREEADKKFIIKENKAKLEEERQRIEQEAIAVKKRAEADQRKKELGITDADTNMVSNSDTNIDSNIDGDLERELGINKDQKDKDTNQYSSQLISSSSSSYGLLSKKQSVSQFTPVMLMAENKKFVTEWKQKIDEEEKERMEQEKQIQEEEDSLELDRLLQEGQKIDNNSNKDIDKSKSEQEQSKSIKDINSQQSQFRELSKQSTRNLSSQKISRDITTSDTKHDSNVSNPFPDNPDGRIQGLNDDIDQDELEYADENDMSPISVAKQTRILIRRKLQLDPHRPLISRQSQRQVSSAVTDQRSNDRLKQFGITSASSDVVPDGRQNASEVGAVWKDGSRLVIKPAELRGNSRDSQIQFISPTKQPILPPSLSPRNVQPHLTPQHLQSFQQQQQQIKQQTSQSNTKKGSSGGGGIQFVSTNKTQGNAPSSIHRDSSAQLSGIQSAQLHIITPTFKGQDKLNTGQIKSNKQTSKTDDGSVLEITSKF